MRLAILHKEKCLPEKCNNLCAKLCPINKKGQDCIKISGKAVVSEELCIGCAICQNRCPFEAITITNLPEQLDKDVVYRYGKNSFCLYKLPIPRQGTLGLLGKNGIGKTTALQILAGRIKINLGKAEASEAEIKRFLQGSELLSYFQNIKNLKFSYKPQNLSEIAKHKLTAFELLKKFGNEKEIKEITKKLDLNLNGELGKLSGGELQKIAIAACALKEADVYFIDEPSAYLDIRERISIAEFISELAEKSMVIIVEHDLLMLDYVTDFVNIFYGKPSCYGIVSGIKATRRGVNEYLDGFLAEENVRFRDKAITFNLSALKHEKKETIAKWPEFTKTYKNFTLKAESGEIPYKGIIGIVGRNGIGKTTFIKCIWGIEETDEKNISLKLKVSYKPQYIKGNEEIVANIIKREKISKRIISLLSLDNLILKQTKQLSGGELQRLAIASCLAKEADIFLIDEPSAYLDVEERVQAARAIKEAIEEKEKTAFVVEHDLLFLSYIANSLIVFVGEPAKSGIASKTQPFIEGLNSILKELGITIRKDRESGRPRINKLGSVLDRKQKEEEKYVEL